MVEAVLVQWGCRRSHKGPLLPSMPQCRGFRCRRPDRTRTRGVILLAGLIATVFLVGCAASPQSLGITGPGDQQKSASTRHGSKSQHNQPYSGSLIGTQED